ncbi:MAG: hypothetical protein P4L33_20240 [Capsulimonadaceae bacterium]|nr:hypothetical protein [Capsulimonadaceae bacterium]
MQSSSCRLVGASPLRIRWALNAVALLFLLFAAFQQGFAQDKANVVFLNASAASGAITLNWSTVDTQSAALTIVRTDSLGNTATFTTAAVNGTSGSWTDNAASEATAVANPSTYTIVPPVTGSAYDYTVTTVPGATGHIFAGYQLPPVTTFPTGTNPFTNQPFTYAGQRGTVDIISDKTVDGSDTVTSPASATALDQSMRARILRLVADLVADGWNVIYDTNHSVARDPGLNGSGVPADVTPAFAGDSVKAVKHLIYTDYQAHPDLKAIIIIGHVSVPYSGDYAPDGHTGHIGAWPADVYYGDGKDDEYGANIGLHQSIVTGWTDSTVKDTKATDIRNFNALADGKFDQDAPQNPILFGVGRIDMSTMPTWSTTSNATVAEEQLLANYLDKDHGYRTGVLTALGEARLTDNFDAYADDGWRDIGSILGPSSVSASNPYGIEANPLTAVTNTMDEYYPIMEDAQTGSYTWMYGDGPGSPNSAVGVGDTADFKLYDPHAFFYMLFGSYFGDYMESDDFMRAALATTTYGLTAFWSNRPEWTMYHMGLGDCAYYDELLSQNAGGSVAMGFLGDPTLRSFVVQPPTGAVAIEDPVASPAVDVAFSPSLDTTVTTYNIYRGTSSSGPFTLLAKNWTPITTSLSADIPACAITTLSSAATTTSPTLVVASATGISAGTTLNLGAGGTTPETVTVASVSGTTLTLTADPAYAHSSGDSVTAVSTMTLGSVAGLSTGTPIEILSGGSTEVVTIAAINGSVVTVVRDSSGDGCTYAHQSGDVVVQAYPDGTAASGTAYDYLVRAEKLESVNSGSYYEQSEGALAAYNPTYAPPSIHMVAPYYASTAYTGQLDSPGGATVYAPFSPTILATASASSGHYLTDVSLYVNGALLQSFANPQTAPGVTSTTEVATNGPLFSYPRFPASTFGTTDTALTSLPAGFYTFSATATDDTGAVVTSNSENLYVIDGGTNSAGTAPSYQNQNGDYILHSIYDDSLVSPFLSIAIPNDTASINLAASGTYVYPSGSTTNYYMMHNPKYGVGSAIVTAGNTTTGSSISVAAGPVSGGKTTVGTLSELALMEPETDRSHTWTSTLTMYLSGGAAGSQNLTITTPVTGPDSTAQLLTLTRNYWTKVTVPISGYALGGTFGGLNFDGIQILEDTSYFGSTLSGATTAGTNLIQVGSVNGLYTTLSADTLVGATSLTVASTAGIHVGAQLHVSFVSTANSSSTPEVVTVTSINGTTLYVTPLANAHASGDNVFTGTQLTVDASPNAETLMIGGVSGTTIFFTTNMAIAHASGAAVGDPNYAAYNTTAGPTWYIDDIDFISSTAQTLHGERAPTIDMHLPVNNQVVDFTPNKVVQISADVAEQDGKVQHVDFIDYNVSTGAYSEIGSSDSPGVTYTGSTYTYNWPITPSVGTTLTAPQVHYVYVVAVSSLGTQTVSTQRKITIQPIGSMTLNFIDATTNGALVPLTGASLTALPVTATPSTTTDSGMLYYTPEVSPTPALTDSFYDSSLSNPPNALTWDNIGALLTYTYTVDGTSWDYGDISGREIASGTTAALPANTNTAYTVPLYEYSDLPITVQKLSTPSGTPVAAKASDEISVSLSNPSPVPVTSPPTFVPAAIAVSDTGIADFESVAPSTTYTLNASSALGSWVGVQSPETTTGVTTTTVAFQKTPTAVTLTLYPATTVTVEVVDNTAAHNLVTLSTGAINVTLTNTTWGVSSSIPVAASGTSTSYLVRAGAYTIDTSALTTGTNYQVVGYSTGGAFTSTFSPTLAQGGATVIEVEVKVVASIAVTLQDNVNVPALPNLLVATDVTLSTPGVASVTQTNVIGTPASPITFTGLTPSTTYTITVADKNSYYQDPSSTVTVTTAAAGGLSTATVNMIPYTSITYLVDNGFTGNPIIDGIDVTLSPTPGLSTVVANPQATSGGTGTVTFNHVTASDSGISYTAKASGSSSSWITPSQAVVVIAHRGIAIPVSPAADPTLDLDPVTSVTITVKDGASVLKDATVTLYDPNNNSYNLGYTSGVGYTNSSIPVISGAYTLTIADDGYLTDTETPVITTSAYANTYTIVPSTVTGQITSTLAPTTGLANITISASTSPALTATTDSSGNYTLTSTPTQRLGASESPITITATDGAGTYQTNSTTVTIVAGTTTNGGSAAGQNNTPAAKPTTAGAGVMELSPVPQPVTIVVNDGVYSPTTALTTGSVTLTDQHSNSYTLTYNAGKLGYYNASIPVVSDTYTATIVQNGYLTDTETFTMAIGTAVNKTYGVLPSEVSGTITSTLAPTVGLDGITVTASGITPALSATTAGGGKYTLTTTPGQRLGVTGSPHILLATDSTNKYQPNSTSVTIVAGTTTNGGSPAGQVNIPASNPSTAGPGVLELTPAAEPVTIVVEDSVYTTTPTLLTDATVTLIDPNNGSYTLPYSSTALGYKNSSVAILSGTYTLKIVDRGYLTDTETFTMSVGTPYANTYSIVPVEIDGTVTDYFTTLPISGATVSLTNASGFAAVQTGATGTYQFRSNPTSTTARLVVGTSYSLSAVKTGTYNSKTATVTIDAGTSTDSLGNTVSPSTLGTSTGGTANYYEPTGSTTPIQDNYNYPSPNPIPLTLSTQNVTVTVKDGATVLSDATVTVTYKQPGTSNPVSVTGTYSSSSGTYNIGIPATTAEYTLVVSDPGYLTDTSQFTFPTGETSLALTAVLVPSEVDFTISNATTSPLSSAIANATTTLVTSAGTLTATNLGGGSYKIVSSPTGGRLLSNATYTLSVTAASYQATTASVTMYNSPTSGGGVPTSDPSTYIRENINSPTPNPILMTPSYQSVTVTVKDGSTLLTDKTTTVTVIDPASNTWTAKGAIGIYTATVPVMKGTYQIVVGDTGYLTDTDTVANMFTTVGASYSTTVSLVGSEIDGIVQNVGTSPFTQLISGAVVTVPGLGGTLSATTGSDGSFILKTTPTIRLVAGTTYTLGVSATNYASDNSESVVMRTSPTSTSTPTTATTPDTDSNKVGLNINYPLTEPILLTPLSQTVTVIVEDGGSTPLAALVDATVMITYPDSVTTAQATYSAAASAYTATVLPQQGKYKVTVSDNGFLTDMSTFAFSGAAGGVTQTVTLVQPEIDGSVINASTSPVTGPIAGATVTVVKASGANGGTLTGTTAADGSFKIVGTSTNRITAGTQYTLSVAASGYQTSSSAGLTTWPNPTSTSGKPDPDPSTGVYYNINTPSPNPILLTPASQNVTVTVQDGSTALGDASVAVSYTGGSTTAVYNKTAGTYVASVPVQSGSYTLSVGDTGYLTDQTPFTFATVGSGLTKSVTLVPSEIDGTVVDGSTLAGIGGATVSIVTTPAMTPATTGASGSFVLKSTPTGGRIAAGTKYTVTVSASSYATSSAATVTTVSDPTSQGGTPNTYVPTGSTTSVGQNINSPSPNPIPLTASQLSLAVTVLDGSTPLSDATVTVTDPNNNTTAASYNTATGTYIASVAAVAGSNYTINTSASGYLTDTSTVAYGGSGTSLSKSITLVELGATVTVTDSATAKPLSGVTVVLSSANAALSSHSAVTASNGQVTFSSGPTASSRLPAGQLFTATASPSLPYKPGSTAVTLVNLYSTNGVANTPSANPASFPLSLSSVATATVYGLISCSDTHYDSSHGVSSAEPATVTLTSKDALGNTVTYTGTTVALTTGTDGSPSNYAITNVPVTGSLDGTNPVAYTVTVTDSIYGNSPLTASTGLSVTGSVRQNAALTPVHEFSSVVNPNYPATSSYPYGLQMISVPYDFTDSLSMSDRFGGSWISGQQIACWDGSSQSWLEPSSFARGQGFWVRFRNLDSLTTPVAGKVGLLGSYTAMASETTPATIKLYAGWNLIGSPWDTAEAAGTKLTVTYSSKSYTWAQATSSTGANLVSPTFFSFDPSSYTYTSVTMDTSGSLQPWVGYWVYAYNACTLVIAH